MSEYCPLVGPPLVRPLVFRGIIASRLQGFLHEAVSLGVQGAQHSMLSLDPELEKTSLSTLSSVLADEKMHIPGRMCGPVATRGTTGEIRHGMSPLYGYSE